MPSILLHLTAIERLAAEPARLPPEIARALTEDLEYGRFGAALADLPDYASLKAGLVNFFSRPERARFAHLFHTAAPVAMGLKMAELVAMGALVGREPGLAFVAGYFTHLCLDRALHPLVDRMVRLHRARGESPLAAHRRVEWAQSLFYLLETNGQGMVGSWPFRRNFQLLKRPGVWRGAGRGLYELVRLSAQETLDQAPSKGELDAWVRGLYMVGLVLSSPVGKWRGLPAFSGAGHRDLYRNPELDFASELDRALEQARAVLSALDGLIQRSSFSPRARGKFLADFPEGPVESDGI